MVRRALVGGDFCFDNLLVKVILCITCLCGVTVTQVVEMSVTTSESHSYDPTHLDNLISSQYISLLGSNLFHFKIHCLQIPITYGKMANSSHMWIISITCGTFFYFDIIRVKVTSEDLMKEKKI